MAFWTQRRVLVTGGASFIGSHLTERLVGLGADVRVVDDLSSGRLDNLAAVRSEIDLTRADLLDRDVAARAVAGREIVLHLAATHGGRGFIDGNQVACASNLALDQTVLDATLAAGCGRLVFASSACVYPLALQARLDERVALRESDVGPPFEPDGLYGLAKLAAERTLEAMHREHGLDTVACRYFTVYGPRSPESHGLSAMIARAFVGTDPFLIWGDGRQRRNWTHVDDIVRGTVLAAERMATGAVNLGSSRTTSVSEAAELVLRLTGHDAEIRTQPGRPTGPVNRCADGSRAEELLGFRPEVALESGLAGTIDWYGTTHDRDQVRRDLERRLVERSGR
jgi:nucleoside-diphosphate-sugar epimerase